MPKRKALSLTNSANLSSPTQARGSDPRGSLSEALTSSQTADDDLLTAGPLTIEPGRMTCRWNGDRVDLTLTEFWIVYALARRPGLVKTREQLMDQARIFVDDATVTSHIKRIRAKFRSLDPAFEGIEAVYGMGYRWAEDS